VPTTVPFNYAKALRDRLLLLLERDGWASLVIRPANRSQRDDKSLRGIYAKAAGGGASQDWPQLACTTGDGSDSGFPLDSETSFGELDSTEPDDGRPVDVNHQVKVELTHESLNDDANDATYLGVIAAWRAGGRHLQDPQTPDGGYRWVVGWSVARQRTTEGIFDAERHVDRITVSLRLQFKPAELSVTTP
jgi:hypothetical protein